MIKLKELEPQLIWKREDNRSFRTDCPDLAQAQGLMFLCPACFRANGNSAIGTHQVICWFNGRGVPDNELPGPGRWNPEGSGIEDLTFVGPSAASIQLSSGCCWHGFITHGEVKDA